MISYPDFMLRSFVDIDIDFLNKHHLETLIVDLDNTLVGWHSHEISPLMLEHVTRLKNHGIALCIASNTYNFYRLASLAKALGIQYYPANARKPGPHGVLAALEIVQRPAFTAAMVGDQLLTDMQAGRRAGMRTILVNPLTKKDFIGTKLVSRSIEALFLRGANARP